MGKALEKAVGGIAVVINDVTAALSFVKDHPDIASTPAALTADIEFNAPVPGGTDGPLVPPGVAVGLNNIKAGFEALKRAPGGDIGGFREKIRQDLATAVQAIFDSLKYQER